MALMRFRRPKTEDQQLTAAALVNVSDPNELRKLQSIQMHAALGSSNAWKWYDAIGELHYGISRTANVAGHAGLQPRERSGTGVGAPVTDRDLLEIYESIWSPFGGLRHLIASYFRIMKLKGHVHLVRNIVGGEFMGYDFVSDDELVFEGDTVQRVTLPGASSGTGTRAESFTTRIAPEDYIGRAWTPHPRYSEMPDSPMGSLDVICEELHLLTLGIRSKLLSRLAQAGILYVPSEVSEVVRQPATDQAQDPVFHNDQVINAIISAMVRNMQSSGDATSIVPIILRGPAEFSEALRHIVFDTNIAELDMRLREEAVKRLLVGLDLMPSSVTGSGDSNHWSAWADRDEELRSNITPVLEQFCWVVQMLIVGPEMERRGINIDHVTWYDLSGATSRPNIGEDAKAVALQGGLSPDSLRQLVGIGDEHKMSDEEYVRWLGAKIGSPYLATFGLGVAERIDWDKVTPAPQPPGPDQTVPPEGRAGPGKGTPGAPGNSESDTPKARRPAA